MSHPAARTADTAAKHRISVIICCYLDDRFELLLASIDSVLRQRTPAHEIIVVVDHNEELEQRIRRSRPQVITIQSDQPAGLSGARNAGIDRATGDIVTFLDDDATAESDWLHRLSEPYDDPTVVGVGGGALPRWERSVPRWLPPEFYWVIGCSWNGLPRVSAPTRNLLGCNMSFRRQACVEAGGFSNDFFFDDRAIVNDETEFCVRLVQRRPLDKLMFRPDVVVHHFVPASRTSVAFFFKRCWREGRAKRITTALVGSSTGLARERVHLMRVLPRAAVRGIWDACRGDPSGVARVVTLIGGTLVTMAAFVLPPSRAR